MKHSRYTVFAVMLSVFIAAFLAFFGICKFTVPDEVSVFAGENACEKLDSGFVSTSYYSGNKQCKKTSVYTKECLSADLFGIIPLKKVDVNVYKNIKLIPGGNAFGVKLYTKGVIVVGLSGDGELHENPAKIAGIKVKDIITSIDGKEVNSVDNIKSIVSESNGAPLNLTIKRGNEEIQTILTPVYSEENKNYIAGVWIRDSTAGIGTVSFINKENNTFAGLGHGICDVDTGEIMPLLRGDVSYVTISGVTKGISGTPGELKGFFSTETIGSLNKNTDYGVFGVLNTLPEDAGEEMPIALKDEITLGKAEIISTVGETKEHYSAEIIKKNDDSSETKNFVIKITDRALLDKTGGIVQGMSGSPVIQNGKIIGAVTHVLVGDPTKGYGIYIENMLKNAN